jgi:hypothetical protein
MRCALSVKCRDLGVGIWDSQRRVGTAVGAQGRPCVARPDCFYSVSETTVFALRWRSMISGSSFLLRYTFDSALSDS